ncbi:hypothetical protein AMEX_G13299 [Astyanax mexicanus]|uniref:Uncharacterized protein n=1 Tax=Astyanax mexicanus TaxID=7994 RepID=A0A8T2LU13_ASTMX|nr:hypothetical protein AMEX_G13299 [Astyanax mexicanus]
MSFIINIYFICTKKYRLLGQRIYNVANSACCKSAQTEQDDEQTSEQDQPEDEIQYSAVDFRKKREDAQNQAEEIREETIYSGLASLGVE